MRRLETVFKEDDQAILIGGDRVDAEYWSVCDGEVVLYDGSMIPIARGPTGPVGNTILPSLTMVKVFSVGQNGVTGMKTISRSPV